MALLEAKVQKAKVTGLYSMKPKDRRFEGPAWAFTGVGTRTVIDELLLHETLLIELDTPTTLSLSYELQNLQTLTMYSTPWRQ